MAPLLESVAGCGEPWRTPWTLLVGLAETVGKGKAGDRLLEMVPEMDGELR